MTGFTSVSIGGVVVEPATASIPVSDIGFVRGLGVFEVLRGIDSRCFRLEPHLARLERSASMLGIELPDQATIGGWAERAARQHEDSVVRILVSAGDLHSPNTARIVVTSETLPPAEGAITLLPLAAPWHSDGEAWELLGGKTLSYANNLAAVRAATLEGFTDALLMGRSGRILEGPTFSVGWTIEEDGRLIYETPSMALGILDSITRQLAFDSAADAELEFREVEVGLDRLDQATEFFALSTLRETTSVTAVGDRSFPEGPGTAALRTAMQQRTSREMQL